MLRRAADRHQRLKKTDERNLHQSTAVEVYELRLSPADEVELFDLMNLHFEDFEDTQFDEESE